MRMAVKRQGVSRRTMLRGTAAAVALPWLESLQCEAASASSPRRMVFLFVPNGMHMPDWRPREAGPLGELPPTLAPLEAHKAKLTVLSGLALDGGRPHGDGPGDHARAAASFLTGAHPYKTHGKDIRNGTSVDQVAAARVGRHTRLPSLELGCEPTALAGNCDSGYSCAYSSNIAWRTPTAPLTKETRPRAVFDRLFGTPADGKTGEATARRAAERKSVLDYVLEDAQGLERSLAGTDRQKLDEYLYAVRELEQRVERHDAPAGAKRPAPDAAPPDGKPKDFAEHVRLMFAMMALALQTDSTRIITFMYGNDGSNRSYPDVGVTSGHHEVSHHAGNAEKHAAISKINRHHIGLLGGFLDALAASKEGEATLLDQAMIVYGSGISDGNRHNHDDLPILLCGRGGGTIAGGRHLKFSDNTPLTNLYRALLKRMDCPVDRFADSDGELAGLD